MDEQDEIDEIHSDTPSGEGQNVDNRSVQGDLEMEMTSYFCFFCQKSHYGNLFDPTPQCLEQ